MLCHKRRESSLQCEPDCTVLDTLSEQVMSGGHEKNIQVRIVCTQPSCEVQWVFSGYAHFFPLNFVIFL